MSRMSRLINYTITDADTWYKVFDIEDYKNNPIAEIKIKLRETTTADHFRYNFDGSASVYMTSTSGWTSIKDLKNLYVFVPTVAGQILEIEILYK